ncbi:hypothetical protein [Okeania sp. KiyG1]|uniref:hypothetical protein n=1 Tax=Okeania sp. KiyG1 TaxID=2720165 RepID=UPI001920AEDC|nr:hypothetical protein [Okeania sp. KiyG1]GGA02086.1 hypothetical protein CYANOKiyG1_14040 [Okeania sp. KiyG1]
MNSANKGYETVTQTDRGYAGHFSSPYSEPMGKPLSIRFPISLDNFLENEAKNLGVTKTAVVREAVRLMEQQKQTPTADTVNKLSEDS